MYKKKLKKKDFDCVRTYISKYANRNLTLLYVNYFESLYLPIIVRRELHKLYNLTVPNTIVNIYGHTPALKYIQTNITECWLYR